VSPISIRQAENDDLELVASLLEESARFLIDAGMQLWGLEQVTPETIAPHVADHLYWIAEVDGTAAGCLRFQLTDDVCWPDLPVKDAAYVHRLAVRRKFAGRRVSTFMLDWAKEHARSLNRRVLRLDCDSERPKLIRLYKSHGFHWHSQFDVGTILIDRFEYTL